MKQDNEDKVIIEKAGTNTTKKNWNEGDVKYNVSSAKTKTTEKRHSPKVTVSLASNLSASVVPYSELKGMFEESEVGRKKIKEGDIIKYNFNKDIVQINGEITQEIQDKSFKPVRLTNQEQKLCYALSYLLTIEEESPRLKLLIDETEAGNGDFLQFPFYINASELTKTMKGEARTRQKNEIGKLLISLSNKVNVIKCPYKKRNGKNDERRTLLFSYPLIEGVHIWDVTEKNDGTKEKVYIGMKARLSRPFFNNVRSQNTPLTPSIFRLWKDSDIFANLFSKLNELWFFAWVGYNQAKDEVLNKYGNKINANKVPEIEEEIHKRQYESITRPLNFDTIANLSEEDYTSTKQKRLRFKKELESCLNRFIEYGIITEGKILPDKKQIIVVFNPHFKGNTDGRVIELNGGRTEE